MGGKNGSTHSFSNISSPSVAQLFLSLQKLTELGHHPTHPNE
jgi:hypothetical protein